MAKCQPCGVSHPGQDCAQYRATLKKEVRLKDHEVRTRAAAARTVWPRLPKIFRRGTDE